MNEEVWEYRILTIAFILELYHVYLTFYANAKAQLLLIISGIRLRALVDYVIVGYSYNASINDDPYQFFAMPIWLVLYLLISAR